MNLQPKRLSRNTTDTKRKDFHIRFPYDFSLIDNLRNKFKTKSYSIKPNSGVAALCTTQKAPIKENNEFRIFRLE